MHDGTLESPSTYDLMLDLFYEPEHISECDMGVRGSVDKESMKKKDVDIEVPSPVLINGNFDKSPAEGYDNVHTVCKEGTELLCCDGKDCSTTYHTGLFDPPLPKFPLGDWHRRTCAYKGVSALRAKGSNHHGMSGALNLNNMLT